jgi:hypothetical protein
MIDYVWGKVPDIKGYMQSWSDGTGEKIVGKELENEY